MTQREAHLRALKTLAALVANGERPTALYTHLSPEEFETVTRAWDALSASVCARVERLDGCAFDPLAWATHHERPPQ